MAYPVAAGHFQMSGNYIPTLYASLLLVHFYTATVFAEIANTKYEGEIKDYGDTVTIRTIPDITINDYTKGQNLDYEGPEPSTVDLLIDKGKYWALKINAVDVKQSDIDFVDKWAMHASEQLKIAIDSGILADIYSDAHADNAGATAGKKSGGLNLGVTGTPVTVSNSTIISKIIDCGTALDEQDAPQSGRYIILPPHITALIKTSDLKDASLAGDGTSIMRNGRVGMIDRFTIYNSNQLVYTGADSAWNCIFGQTEALTFASQMTKTEIIPDPNDFGTLMRSLQVYGYKVIKPEALGHLYLTT